MAEFEIEGKSYDTKNFSEHQKELIKSLSVTKQLIAELMFKNELFFAQKKELEKTLSNELGSKITEIWEDRKGPQIKLENGKKLKLSDLSDSAVTNSRNLSFLNEQINYYYNQLQVLDTAKITYSKIFFETIKGAE
jgi:hypothetical protein